MKLQNKFLVVSIIILIMSLLASCSNSNNANVTSTLIKIEFPFEPSPPGYIVDIKSDVLTANLMCAVESGEILNLDESSDSSKKWGTCDTGSMTLDVGISSKMTVTVILGGFPVVNEVTKSPEQITGNQAEYLFESSFP